MEVLLSDHLLQSTLREKLIVNMSRVRRGITESTVLTLFNHIGSEAVQDLILIRAGAVDPFTHLIKHLPLNLGYFWRYGQKQIDIGRLL